MKPNGKNVLRHNFTDKEMKIGLYLRKKEYTLTVLIYINEH